MIKTIGRKSKSPFFVKGALGLVFGNLSGAKGEDGGSGFVAPLGIDLGLLVGATVGVGRRFGIAVTPGIVAGRMGFVVVAVGIHFNQSWGIGLVVPVWLIWG